MTTPKFPPPPRTPWHRGRAAARAAVEPTQPAAEREPGDPGHGHDSERRRQTERLRGSVELSQSEPRFGPDRPRLRINPDGFHAGQVKHHGAVTHGVPCDAVPAPAHREREVVPTCERDTADHVGRIRRPDHRQGAPVDHAVEHSTSRVVPVVTGADHVPPQIRAELLTDRARDPAHVYRHRGPLSQVPALSGSAPDVSRACGPMHISVMNWLYKHKRS